MYTFRYIFYFLLTPLLLVGCQEKDHIDVVPPKEINIEFTESRTFTTIELQKKHLGRNQSSTTTSLGLCYGTSPDVSLDDQVIYPKNSSGRFILNNLTPNTTYYFKFFIRDPYTIMYSKEKMTRTLSVENTKWSFNINYGAPQSTSSNAIVNFYADGSTKSEEILPDGTILDSSTGTWSLDQNEIKFIFNGNKSDTEEHIYLCRGSVKENKIIGKFEHKIQPSGTWSATIL